MGTKTVSLRVNQELFDYLHTQSVNTGETITDVFWSMYKLIEDEIHNKYDGNMENTINNSNLESNNNKNWDKHTYIKTTEEENNIISYMSQCDTFLDNDSCIEWIYNNGKETKIIIDGKIIIKKVFTN